MVRKGNRVWVGRQVPGIQDPRPEYPAMYDYGTRTAPKLLDTYVIAIQINEERAEAMGCVFTEVLRDELAAFRDSINALIGKE